MNPPETTVEEANQLQRSKKKLRNDGGTYIRETSRISREEDWMYDKTTFVGAKGRRRTYADLVIHGSTENNEDSEDSDEEMTNEGESSDEDESGMMEEMLEWSQAQRKAYRKA
ncbi:hypothetical protein S83_011446 [Arachis hypogaea]